MFDFNYKAKWKNAQGMTLIEVMVALVILSVGLLGLAGLQVQGLRGTSGSNSRVQAIFIINDMAERMHANGVAVNKDLTYQNVAIDASDCGNAPTDCSVGNNCNTADMATYENYDVCQAMADNLPYGATLNITCGLGAGCIKESTHTLVLNWSQVQDASLGSRTQSITLQIQPIQLITQL